MSARKEFVLLACQEGANIRALCRQFGISPKTGYKLLRRYATEGEAGLADRPKRPKSSPNRTPDAVEASILALRDQHPAWGGRKLGARLKALGHTDMPCPSTITAILRRHDRIDTDSGIRHKPWHRFEHPAPNDLWQMDFKGHVALLNGRCHPLTVLDDHSRYSVCLSACANEQTGTVQAALTAAFRNYGLPWRMTMDNGPPWGDDRDNPYTPLTVWLLRLGIKVSHSRPYPPKSHETVCPATHRQPRRIQTPCRVVKRRFPAPQQQAVRLHRRTKSPQPVDKAGPERLQTDHGRPPVADPLLPPPLSDPDKFGGGFWYQRIVLP
ncbi:DDE-type integrase/transposase/recombinase [Methylovulum psychrotolerans]|uniref:DDE-type integrase/transposase/recombinase n=1 Tax=Methylovulum psychrotolerans TaxID=1704499 RepID=UPI0018DFC882|nr:DDE-type integrase/transposase/recombinase [Methylovulum psychrotolerans]